VIAVDVLAGEAKELVVIRPFEMVTARTVDCSHLSSFVA